MPYPTPTYFVSIMYLKYFVIGSWLLSEVMCSSSSSSLEGMRLITHDCTYAWLVAAIHQLS
jgi:hypothetical protein